MTLYDYVAINDPHGAKLLIQSYGYPLPGNVEDEDVLAMCLNNLVAAEGDEALSDIIEMHPDGKLIIEKYSAKDMVRKEKSDKSGCGCGGKCGKQKAVSAAPVDTSQTQSSGWQLHQGNLFLIAATLILAVAIITTNKQSS